MCFGSGFFDGIKPHPPRREKYKDEEKYQRDYARNPAESGERGCKLFVKAPIFAVFAVFAAFAPSAPQRIGISYLSRRFDEARADDWAHYKMEQTYHHVYKLAVP
ncbi:hypothetical protein PCH_Pc21g14150 [Penicillium rubens Wisconsin 54-1255]|uniref:Uncharacterized protein n=1 Tax=Penicillium rubens (strain ATCC 28089 / DSM 1075 / NRRL 1951 / Wisconsin 54-1255) TaxID=500485 RepID=B6HHN8_PENRW|nr:hypothetical protein PCH_Pc21g14150 [Penicillium rubens Wisconsin 54-1255]